MNRTDLLAVAKPILFNTEMVKAILDGRKTVTRRVVKNGNRTPTESGRNQLYMLVDTLNNKAFTGAGFYKDSDIFVVDGVAHTDAEYFKSAYKVGDILYVRETFCKWINGKYYFKADPIPVDKGVREDVKWKPALHMPKEAARIFPRVTGVRVQRLWDISPNDCIAEGVYTPCVVIGGHTEYCNCVDKFSELWNFTIKKVDIEKYGWDVNPFVWVYEFERVEVDD